MDATPQLPQRLRRNGARFVVSPLDDLSLGLCQRIATAISALDGGEGERRAAPHYAQALADYATRRAELENR